MSAMVAKVSVLAHLTLTKHSSVLAWQILGGPCLLIYADIQIQSLAFQSYTQLRRRKYQKDYKSLSSNVV